MMAAFETGGVHCGTSRRVKGDIRATCQGADVGGPSGFGRLKNAAIWRKASRDPLFSKKKKEKRKISKVIIVSANENQSIHHWRTEC